MKKLIIFLTLISFVGFANAQTAYITNENDSSVTVINVASNAVY